MPFYAQSITTITCSHDCSLSYVKKKNDTRLRARIRRIFKASFTAMLIGCDIEFPAISLLIIFS